MDLSDKKSEVMIFPSTHPRLTRRQAHWVLNLEDSDIFSLEKKAEEMNELEFQHDHFHYLLPDGMILIVKEYKYLGIAVDPRLGNS
jgi:hypothetical protein